MADSYQDKKRKSEELFRAAATEQPEETTPPEINAQVALFGVKLGQESARYVPVVTDEMGLYGWCSDGVLEKIKKDGGGIRFGWTIWEWPRVLLTGEFHAVWVSPQGDLIDITPKPHREDRIVFVPDPNYPGDFDFDKRPLNKRHRLYESADPSEKIAAHIARMKAAQRIYEEKRAAKAGVTLEQLLRNKIPEDVRVKLIDDFIRVCDRYDTGMDATSSNGYVQLSPKLQRLLMEKIRLLEQIKRGR